MEYWRISGGNDYMRSDNKNLFLIISSSLITKVVLIVFILLMVGSLSDTYDMNLYYNSTQNVLNGHFPWYENNLFNYPILSLIPMFLSYFISNIIGGEFDIFFYSMVIFMNICDIIICISVYYIGKKLYSDKSALRAALLCAISISVVYYTLYKFDPFPSMLLMLSILFTLYGYKTKGYISSVVGMFVKIFPIIAYPFLWMYNSKDGIKSNASIILGIGVSIFVGLMLMGYDKFLMVTDFTYCNTIQYTLSQFIGSYDFIPLLFKILTVGIIIASLYKMYISKKSPVLMIQLIFVCMIAVIFLSAYRSPQYLVWFAPLAAILVCNDKLGILSYIAFQIISFVEYPFAYGMIYDNQHYMYSSTVWFFVLYFVILGVLVWRTFNKSNFSYSNV